MNDATDLTANEAKTPSTSTESTSASITSIVMPEVGQRIGPNRILELIAEGGMANVYKVWHEGLEIVRAIKILKPGFSEESKQRLHTEAKISAHLHHPNIVEIYGVSFWKDVVPYLEMEYIDGFSLRDLLKHQKHVHYTFALAIGYFVCNALSYAHSQVFTLYGKPYQGVVHRDIKPANILLSRTGVVKLADFGIAKPSEISLHTVGQKVMGTFSYLSPEQLNGDPLDYRCDIYALGTVLYEIVTGSKAFPQKVMSELIQKKMLNEYMPVNDFEIEAPKQFCAIVDKCMALKKEKRYATGPDVVEELAGLLHKNTAKTPEQIVLDYLKNPKGSVYIPKKRLFTAPFIIAIVMLIACAIGFSTLLVAPTLRRAAAPAQVRQTVSSVHSSPLPEALAPEPRLEESKLPALPSHSPKQPDRPQYTGNGRAKHAESIGPTVRGETRTAINKEEKTTGVAAAPGIESFKLGMSAARAKRYGDAIGYLERALDKDLTESQRADATITLMESYVTAADAAGAQRLINAHFLNDGYFYLLCGKTYVMLGKFDRAIEAFGNAQTTASRYNASTLPEATYLWAKTLDEVYKLKPNAENKNSCIRAWRQFSKAFCSGDAAAHCAEAQQRMATFTPQ